MFDPQRGSAWLVKGHHDEDLRGHSAVFATLEQAILKHQHINFIYSSQRNTNKRYSLIEPYKLINHKGIWYLAAWDVDRLKSFSVSKLEALQAQPSHFVPRPQIDQELAASDGIWLGSPRQHVLLQVAAAVAECFKRRQLIPHQVIERTLDGSDMLVSTSVAHADAVLPMVRYWLPHIQIVEPPGFLSLKRQQFSIHKLALFSGALDRFIERVLSINSMR